MSATPMVSHSQAPRALGDEPAWTCENCGKRIFGIGQNSTPRLLPVETGHGRPHPNTFLALYSRQKSAYCYTTCIRKGRVGHECLLTNVRPYVHISVSSLGTYINRLPSNLIPNRADSIDCSSPCFSPKAPNMRRRANACSVPLQYPTSCSRQPSPKPGKKNSKFTVPLTVV
jgi:hypothetical protein